jgi:hypothetical protein
MDYGGLTWDDRNSIPPHGRCGMSQTHRHSARWAYPCPRNVLKKAKPCRCLLPPWPLVLCCCRSFRQLKSLCQVGLSIVTQFAGVGRLFIVRFLNTSCKRSVDCTDLQVAPSTDELAAQLQVFVQYRYAATATVAESRPDYPASGLISNSSALE